MVSSWAPDPSLRARLRRSIGGIAEEPFGESRSNLRPRAGRLARRDFRRWGGRGRLRAVGVSYGEVSPAESFAGWSGARLPSSLPITPGGIGVVEIGMAGMLIGFGGPSGRVAAWLQPGTGLPLELVVTSRPEPLVGEAHYRENATLRLVSTTPQR